MGETGVLGRLDASPPPNEYDLTALFGMQLLTAVIPQGHSLLGAGVVWGI